MAVVLRLNENPGALQMLFKSYDLRFDNESKRSFNDRWLSPSRPKTETNDNGYRCTLYTTETNDNHRWSSLVSGRRKCDFGELLEGVKNFSLHRVGSQRAGGQAVGRAG